MAPTLGILENFHLAGYKPSNLDINGGKPSNNGSSVLEGGADPRRENIALGDTFKP